MAADTSAYLHGLDPTIPRLDLAKTDLTIDGGHLGPGYGLSTEKARSAVQLAHDLEGLDLEHVYTGKALAALIDHAPRLSDSVVLFWNTHSSRQLPLRDVDPRDVPADLRGYFARR
jgi:1-aminocyclopropane-1-carboxylate deaminase/D-cysteine desulfhydrase-like pyridoxal-dependent ACC family enzyme